MGEQKTEMKIDSAWIAPKIGMAIFLSDGNLFSLCKGNCDPTPIGSLVIRANIHQMAVRDNYHKVQPTDDMPEITLDAIKALTKQML